MKAFWFEEKSSGPRKKMTFSFFSFNCLLKREKMRYIADEEAFGRYHPFIDYNSSSESLEEQVIY